ncbi:hypothetical protein GCM10010116_32890 [Microbispora rosea subsp. aerata]|nr:hypothetical protein GCM10010116_32890 [Microbispora rosea subsp. aerata]
MVLETARFGSLKDIRDSAANDRIYHDGTRSRVTERQRREVSLWTTRRGGAWREGHLRQTSRRIAAGGPHGGEAAQMSARTPEAEPLLTPAEVATMFRVDPKTVTRWAKAGKLTSIRTLGGHRRYRETEVRALLAGIPQQRSE